MPQVHAVAALAYPHEGLQREHARHPRSGDDEHDDHDRRQHRGQRDASLVGKRREAIRERHDCHEPRERAHPHDVERYPGEAVVLRDPRVLAERRRGQREREPHAHEQAHRARVGAVVDAARVAMRVVEQRHLGARCNREHDRHGGDVLLLEPQLVHEDEREGPHEVELLLDREAPEVLERRGRTRGLEVRQVAEDLPPVVVEQQRRHDVGTHLVEQHVVEHGAERGRAHHRERNGRKQPAHAAHPEALERDAARRLVLGHEQPVDQIARYDEEHRDAHEPTRRPAHLHVVQDDGEHRERAQPVERGNIGRLGPGVLVRSCPHWITWQFTSRRTPC